MKKIFAIALCLILVIGLAACGASKTADAEVYTLQNSYAVMDDMFVTEEAADAAGGINYTASSSSASKTDSDEKIIKTVELSVQTKEYTAYIVPSERSPVCTSVSSITSVIIAQQIRLNTAIPI